MPRALVVLLALFVPVGALAQEPWDRPAFSSDPKELLAAAAKIDSGEHDAVELLDEAVYTFDADGRSRTVARLMYRITGEPAVAPLGQLNIPWSPWYHDKPVVTARVVTKDGTVHTLDQSAVTEAPANPDSLDIFSDDRVLRAPLPAVEIGSVIEYVITEVGRGPLADAGMAHTFVFGSTFPVHRVRLVLDAPAELQPRIVNRSGVEPRVEEKDGRRRTIFERRDIAAIDELEENLPFDVAPFAHVSFATGKSWGDIARRYSEVVDKQIAGSELQKLVRGAIGNATDRKEIVARILAAIQKDIRYAGVEVGEGSIIPRTPKTVLANKYGDCKDKAALLVAMLREAGLEAHVALLRAGDDLDVHDDLPGLGQFNHAIAIVAGDPAIWVDPTDVYARAGELPAMDQGRMALIAAPATTSLTRTPEAKSTENVTREVRTFTLPEDGKARVVEFSVPGRTDESQWRRYAAESDKKEYREAMEEYAESYYLAKKLDKLDVADPRALDEPFTVTLEMPESSNGIVMAGEGAVAIHPSGLVTTLPDSLTDWEEPNPNEQSDAKKDKKRVHDFLFPVAMVKEWEYRIVPPAGYVARKLPDDESKQLGTTTLTKQFAAQPDGVVVARLTFDSGKRRISAKEFEETRIALSKLLDSDQFVIGFDQVGQARLNAGDVGGAIGEFRRLADLHPKEAQHHLEIARALLAGGLGDAARVEAYRAVKIEPANARAHETLAFVLQHDLLGRQYRKGADFTGAVAALRKAKELKPAEMEIRTQLAALLTIGEDGIQYGRKARLAEALEELKQISSQFGAEGKGVEPDMLLVYAHLGRFREMKELAATLESAQQRDLGRVIAIAALDGGGAAVRELGSFDAATKRKYAEICGRALMMLRMYEPAAMLIEVAAQGATNATEMRAFAEMLKKARRLEDLQFGDDARGFVQQMMRDLFAGVPIAEFEKRDAKRVRGLSETDAGDFGSGGPLGGFEATLQAQGMPMLVAGDLGLANVQFQTDGSEKTGWRLRMRVPQKADAETTFFIVREEGRFALVGTIATPALLGRMVLGFADAGELETARTWLNWIREDMQAAGGDDPLAGLPFPKYWPKAKATATLDELRLGAAMLILRSAATKESEPILLAARETAENAKTAIDLALGAIYTRRKEWAKLLPVAERLSQAHPESDAAFTSYTVALALTGQSAKVVTLANERLARIPRDREAMRALSLAATETGDYAAAQKYAQQLIDEITPQRSDYNQAAWLALFTGADVERAIEHAQHANAGGGSAPTLHTLAALYAETGKTLEARTALLKSMELRNRTEPAAEDWYVLGRIAENYGVRDSALAAYKRVDKKENNAGADTWELAERRLQALSKKP